MKIIDSVKQAVEQYGMLNGVSKVCVALSGGADSVALLHIMLSVSKEYGIDVSAFHLNHNLRGAESDRDEAFVRNLCSKYSVPLTVKSVNVGQIAKNNKVSVELAARNARYECFEAFGTVATAHTADDNLETVIINLARGSSLEGMCGIPPKRDNLIRPLIFATRAQVEQYCNENGLSYVTDSTNLTDDYTRNKLRHNAVPVIKDINPSAPLTVANMCKLLRQENAFLDNLAQSAYNRIFADNRLDVSGASQIDDVILRRVIRMFVFNQCGIMPDSGHTESVLSIVKKGKGNCPLPLDNTAVVIKKHLKIEKNRQPETEYSVKVEVVSTEEYKNRLKVNKLLSKSAIDNCKIIGDGVVLRTRDNGDSIKLAKRGTKTLKKLYNELAIPKQMRANLPVAEDSQGVVWVHGIGAAQRVEVDENTKLVTLFTVTEK